MTRQNNSSSLGGKSIQESIVKDSNQEDTIDLAIEIWRLEKRLNKVASSLSEDQNKAFNRSINKLYKCLKKTSNVEVNDYTGEPHNEGMNVDPLHIEDDKNSNKTMIMKTHEPEVKYKDKVIRKAKVIVEPEKE